MSLLSLILSCPYLPRYEPALLEAEDGLDLLVTEMLKCMDKPFAFFARGHSAQASYCTLALLFLAQPRSAGCDCDCDCDV